MTKFLNPISEVLEASGLNSSEIDKLVLCGGTAKILKLQKAVQEMFPKAEFLNSIVRNPTFSENLAYRQITIFSTF